MRRQGIVVVIRILAAVCFLLQLAVSVSAQAPLPRCPCDESLTRLKAASVVPTSSEATFLELAHTPPSATRPSKPLTRSPLQMIVPERVLNRLLTEERTESGPVRDIIANTDVVGAQQTVSRVQVDCRPNIDRAEIHLVLQGIVRSDTLGVTSQGSVNTLGQHGVVAIKPVMFDGTQITTRQAQVWVDVQNRHVAASTRYDGVPFFSEMARSTAFAKAERLRPQADSDTAESLASRIGPQFNRDADKRLAKFNRTWRDELQSKAGDFWPARLSVSTTDSELRLSAAWTDVPEIEISDQALATGTSSLDSITVRLHESVLNAALEKLSLAGQTISEPELRAVFEKFVTKLGGQVVATKKLQTASLPIAVPQIHFADKLPLHVKIDEDRLLLIVNASVEIAGQTVLAQDEMTLPLTVTAKSGGWLWQPGTLVFAKGDQGVSLVGMLETLARSQLAEALPATILPASIDLPGDQTALNSLRLTKTAASAGWLTFSLSVDSPLSPISEEAAPVDSPNRRIPSTQPTESRRVEPARIPSATSLGPKRIPASSDRGWTSTTTPRRVARQTRDPSDWFE